MQITAGFLRTACQGINTLDPMAARPPQTAEVLSFLQKCSAAHLTAAKLP